MSELPPRPFVIFLYPRHEEMPPSEEIPSSEEIVAKRWENYLQALGIHVWTYEQLLPGTYIPKARKEAIHAADAVILLFFERDYSDDQLLEELQEVRLSQRPVLPLLPPGLALADLLPSSLLPEHAITIDGSSEEAILASIIQVLEALGFIAERFPIRIRIIQNPLTAQNLTLVLSALTELSTKYWLIAERRFADLIEYTQTHNDRFAEEAQIVIARVSHNSPFNMDWKIDLSAPSVAEALVTTIDGITQRKERLEKAQLENQAQAQAIKEAEQKSEHANHMALLEQEKQRLEIEQHRLDLLEKQLEVQKKGIEYALEIAEKVVDTLHPGADSATRAMEIQALLPNLVQLQNGKGLELALHPLPLNSAERP